MRVLNKRTDKIPADALYIGRPSEWGNPYVIGRDGSREEVIRKYRHWLWTKVQSEGTSFLIKLAEVTNKPLVCYCHPLPCHGDVLIKASEWAKNQLEP